MIRRDGTRSGDQNGPLIFDCDNATRFLAPPVLDERGQATIRVPPDRSWGAVPIHRRRRGRTPCSLNPIPQARRGRSARHAPAADLLRRQATVADGIAALLPVHHNYVEPFIVSLAVLLAMRLLRMETVNALDGHLMMFWVLRDRPADPARACALPPHVPTERDASHGAGASTSCRSASGTCWTSRLDR